MKARKSIVTEVALKAEAFLRDTSLKGYTIQTNIKPKPTEAKPWEADEICVMKDKVLVASVVLCKCGGSIVYILVTPKDSDFVNEGMELLKAVSPPIKIVQSKPAPKSPT